VHCTTQPETQKLEVGLDVGFSSCTAPTYYWCPSISDIRSPEPLEVNLRQSIALIDVRVEFRLKLEVFWNVENRVWELME